MDDFRRNELYAREVVRQRLRGRPRQVTRVRWKDRAERDGVGPRWFW
jgi:hypothetical protein